MEIQKHLFKISERALKNPSAICWFKTIFYITTTIAIYTTLALIFGHAMVLSNNTPLSSCISALKLPMDNDTIFMVSEGEPQGYLQTANKQNKTVWESPQCSVIKNKNYSAGDQELLYFGWDYVAMFTDRNKKEQFNFDNYTVMLKQTKPMRSILFGFDILIANQILNNPSQMFGQQGIYIKSRNVYVAHIDAEITIWMKIYYLFKVTICFTAISIVTTLYIYGTIVAAPAVIIILLRCCNQIRGEGAFNDVYKLFPWIGTHTIIRDTSQNNTIKQSGYQICYAMLFYFFFLYLVYYATIIWIDKGLYHGHVELGLQEMVFGYIAISEFAAIIFMRTRTFLKYYPPLHCLLMITLLYYGQVCDYGFKRMLCYWAFSVSGALFSWMILKLQIPAFNQWDQNLPNTPREDRPRAGFFPLFNMGWIKNLPQEWTLMMPLFGREHFNSRQLSLVDRNNDELALVLGNR